MRGNRYTFGYLNILMGLHVHLGRVGLTTSSIWDRDVQDCGRLLHPRRVRHPRPT